MSKLGCWRQGQSRGKGQGVWGWIGRNSGCVKLLQLPNVRYPWKLGQVPWTVNGELDLRRSLSPKHPWTRERTIHPLLDGCENAAQTGEESAGMCNKAVRDFSEGEKRARERSQEVVHSKVESFFYKARAQLRAKRRKFHCCNIATMGYPHALFGLPSFESRDRSLEIALFRRILNNRACSSRLFPAPSTFVWATRTRWWEIVWGVLVFETNSSGSWQDIPSRPLMNRNKLLRHRGLYRSTRSSREIPDESWGNGLLEVPLVIRKESAAARPLRQLWWNCDRTSLRFPSFHLSVG